MVSSFKDSMTNYKFGLMEYSIIIQRKRRIEFFKKKLFYLMKYSIGMYKKWHMEFLENYEVVKTVLFLSTP